MTYSIYINERCVEFDADHVFTEKDVDEYIHSFFFSGKEADYAHEDLIQGLFRAAAGCYPERMKTLYLEMVQKHPGMVLGMLRANLDHSHSGANWWNYGVGTLYSLCRQLLKELLPGMVAGFMANKRQKKFEVMSTKWSEGTFKISLVKTEKTGR